MLFVPFWFVAFKGVRKDIREVHEITDRIILGANQLTNAENYHNLTREDFELLGIGREGLTAACGEEAAAALWQGWYGPSHAG